MLIEKGARVPPSDKVLFARPGTRYWVLLLEGRTLLDFKRYEDDE